MKTKVVIFISLTNLVGCGAFNSVDFSSSSDSVFGKSSQGEFVYLDEDGDGIPDRIPEEEPVGVDPTECVVPGKTAGLNALANSIKTRAATTDQSTGRFEVINCEAGLANFAARAVNANGTTVTAKQIQGRAFLGVYCSNKNRPGQVALHAQMFKTSKLRGDDIVATYICRAGSDAASCGPNSADFIGGLKYGKSGGDGRISSAAAPALQQRPKNQNSTVSAAAGTDPLNLVAEILIPGGLKYTDLNKCTTVNLYSPIVIEKAPGLGVTTLHPLATSTLFDLTGEGRKERISCVTNAAFLALPGANGRIEDIGQLFGDNTVGPDGRKAANGYMALGKHDQKSNARGYGSITREDRVFADLRLWEDLNCNGVAEARELSRLSDWNIAAIHWKNAKRMNEIDRYGNATLLRHSVTRSDGANLRSFDIWFKDYSK